MGNKYTTNQTKINIHTTIQRILANGEFPEDGRLRRATADEVAGDDALR